MEGRPKQDALAGEIFRAADEKGETYERVDFVAVLVRNRDTRGRLLVDSTLI
jgi:hypothetical protein